MARFRQWLLVVIARLAVWLRSFEPAMDSSLQATADHVVRLIAAKNLRTRSRHDGLVRNYKATRLLQKRFPEARTREIKLAIELAMKGMP